MDAAWRAWHSAALQASVAPVQPHHETTLLVRRGPAWDSLDLAGRHRMVRATELAVADGFILFKQVLLYAYRQLREQEPWNEATRGMVQDTLVHLACFRRYAQQAAERAVFFGDTAPGQLGRRHRPLATRALCWLLRREPRLLHELVPILKCLSVAYSRALLRDRSQPNDPWRALQALHLRDESEHLGACCRLLAEQRARIPWRQRLRLGLGSRAALGLLVFIASGNRCGVWRLAWTQPPCWEARLDRLRQAIGGGGGHRGLYAVARRYNRRRKRLIVDTAQRGPVAPR